MDKQTNKQQKIGNYPLIKEKSTTIRDSKN